MELRMFQIIVPAITLIFILIQVRKVYLLKAVWKDVGIGIIFAFIIGLLALFPDLITNKLANLLDFESNINAILFSLIGLLIISMIRLYDLYRTQQRNITKLTQELAVLMGEKHETVP